MKDSSEQALEGGAPPVLSTTSTEEDYLRLTSSAYESSTDYMTSNLRLQWERNINNFFSRHPPGSKYRTEAFRHRSRLFRPKTRTSIRNKEAALAIALFSTSDAVSIEAADQSDEENVTGARIIKELVNTRLQDREVIPWFKLCIGAFQDANVMGTAIFHEYWDYQTEEQSFDEQVPTGEVDELGQPFMETVKKKKTVVVKDQPAIELIENENFRIDPGASWLDPVGTSPYTIQLIPMYVVDILKRMEETDQKTGQPAWIKLSIEEISRANTTQMESDSTRLAREHPRQDPKSDQFTDISEHQIVWVYRVIMDIPGKGDMLWYTLGSQQMLSKPIPLKDAYLHGKRPYSTGNVVLEAHKNYPSGSAELGQDTQAATNENQNLRFDNIKQVINKRWLARRGSSVDLRSLRRNVTGSITMTGDPEKDVKELKSTDVTQSAFQEQNMFNADFDDVTGGFSPSTVQTSKELGETVGGMRMLKEPSNVISEYSIRIFSETLIWNCLTNLVALEVAYETDEKLLMAAAHAAGVKEDEFPRDLFNKGYKVKINVGFGVTDPQARVSRFMAGFEGMKNLAPKKMQMIKDDEVATELFGILGYQDGSRFFMDQDEFKEYQEANPPGKDIETAKIESTEKIEAARLELSRLVEEAKILSKERQVAAELQLQYGKAEQGIASELGKKDIDIAKVQIADKKLEYDREDSLRKDSEIKSKEAAVTNRSGSK